MDSLLPIAFFSQIGHYLMGALLAFSCLAGVLGLINLPQSRPVGRHLASGALIAVNLLFVAGFLWICWFHYRIYQLLPLELPAQAADWLNQQLALANRGSAYALPMYDPAQPPRYAIPVWIENEKYYFWFMCYGLMALVAHLRLQNHRLRAMQIVRTL